MNINERGVLILSVLFAFAEYYLIGQWLNRRFGTSFDGLPDRYHGDMKKTIQSALLFLSCFVVNCVVFYIIAS